MPLSKLTTVRALLVASAATLCASCGFGGTTYTLYRSSAIEAKLRVHVATFDATSSDESYNKENCNIAADLFQKQPGVTVRYWCEKGAYSKQGEL